MCRLLNAHFPHDLFTQATAKVAHLIQVCLFHHFVITGIPGSCSPLWIQILHTQYTQLGFDADILEIHLNELDDVVNNFFIIESTRTHNKAWGHYAFRRSLHATYETITISSLHNNTSNRPFANH